MKRKAQPRLTTDGQQVLGQYRQVLQQFEDISPVVLRNYLSDLRPCIAWREDCWGEERDFPPQAVASALLIRSREYLQTSPGLKPSAVNRTLMSLKRSFAWTRKMRLMQADPTSPSKFVPKEAAPPRHLSDEEEEAPVETVNAVGTLRDQTMLTLLLHTGLRAQELCTLTRQQVALSKRNGALRILGKRTKVREVPLSTTARSALNQYLKTLPPECPCFFPSEQTHGALTGRAPGHFVTKYATQAQIADLSPHDLRHRFGYRMAEVVPLRRLARIMGHDSLDTTMLYVRGNTARSATRCRENRMDRVKREDKA